jgi:hypothetical protein
MTELVFADGLRMNQTFLQCDPMARSLVPDERFCWVTGWTEAS